MLVLVYIYYLGFYRIRSAGTQSGCHRLVPGHNLGEIECTGKLMPDKGNQGSNERHPASKPGALRDSNGNMRMQFSLEHKCPG